MEIYIVLDIISNHKMTQSQMDMCVCVYIFILFAYAI